jgi:hypothetical protein
VTLCGYSGGIMSGGARAIVYVIILGCIGILALTITDEAREVIGPLAASCLPWVLLAAFLLWVISAGVRRGMKAPARMLSGK